MKRKPLAGTSPISFGCRSRTSPLTSLAARCSRLRSGGSLSKKHIGILYPRVWPGTTPHNPVLSEPASAAHVVLGRRLCAFPGTNHPDGAQLGSDISPSMSSTGSSTNKSRSEGRFINLHRLSEPTPHSFVTPRFASRASQNSRRD